MTDETTERALPVQAEHLDGATISKMLEPKGALGMDPDDYKLKRYLGLVIDVAALKDAHNLYGPQAVMDQKDDILRDLDTRLMEVMELA